MKSIILQEKELKIARSVLLAAHLEQKKIGAMLTGFEPATFGSFGSDRNPMR